MKGIVYDEKIDNKPSGLMVIKVSKGGDGRYYLSGIIRAFNLPARRFTGSFANNRYEAVIEDPYGVITRVNLAFAYGDYGRKMIGGFLEAADKSVQKVNLAKNYYNKNFRPYPLVGRYTYYMPSLTTASSGLPGGSAIGYSGINSLGALIIKGWSNSGYKYTYKKFLQNGNRSKTVGTVPFYVETFRKNDPANEWLLGTLRHERNLSGNTGAIQGRLRYFKPVSNSKYYPAGFDQSLIMRGSKYVSTLYTGIPSAGFNLLANNAQGLFDGSFPDSIQPNPYVFTWNPDGNLNAPLNFVYYVKGKYVNGGGFYTCNYIDNIIGQSLWIRGVVIQNQGIVIGHAENSRFGVTLRHSIIPNDTGEVAPSASISPTSKKFDNIRGQSPGGTYSVNIEISPNSVVQNWTVDIPAEYDWVTADVTEGSGSATINITVGGRSTGSTDDFFDRTAVIQIGGFNHTITQEKRTAN